MLHTTMLPMWQPSKAAFQRSQDPSLEIKKASDGSFAVVPRAGVGNSAFMRVFPIFREEIVKPVSKPRKLLRRQCFYFICPKNAKNPPPAEARGGFLFGPCILHQSDISSVSISLFCHVLIFRCARSEYFCCGCCVLIDGFAGSGCDPSGHAGKVAPQPVSSSTGSISSGSVFSDQLSMGLDGFIFLPFHFCVPVQRGGCVTCVLLCVLLLELGNLAGQPPAIAHPPCPKKKSRSESGPDQFCLGHARPSCVML